MWYPPPYERKLWHYQPANIDQIKRAVEQFPWEKSFRNLRINEMVYLFNKTIKNILSNYISMKQLLVMIEVIETHLGLTTILSS